MRTRRLALALGLALQATACGDGSGGTQAQFAIPGELPAVGADFYSLPFPNDLRRDPDHTIALADFPTNSSLIESYRVAAEELDGFGLNSSLFARFTGPLDPASLPDLASSITDDASVYLVDIDAASPERGHKVLVNVHFVAPPTGTVGANHLVVRPYPGFGLAEYRQYALVLTRRLRDAAGEPVVPSDSFEAVLATGGSADIGALRARTIYQPLLQYLDEPGGDERADVVSAAVFTTQHITGTALALREAIATGPATVATSVVSQRIGATFEELTGAYVAPNFQTGAVPYDDPGSGRILVTGITADVQRMEPMRFALAVPIGETPATGWPLVIYQHGTGGSFRSFIEDGTAAALAARGLAVISTDQVLHGPRNPGGNPELDYFKFINPYAMRDNSLQGAADAWSQLRLADGLAITTPTRTITFDPTRVYCFAHSQGGLTAPPFIALEPRVKAAVLSGTGGLLYLALLNKRRPFDIPTLLAGYLGDDPVDEDNASLALLQMWVERADGANYAPLMVRDPVSIDGTQNAPRDIFQTEGFTDSYTPNVSIEAFATALGSDLVELPAAAPVPGVRLRGRTTLAPPFAHNASSRTGVPATLALAQFTQQASSDGHFVVFDLASAKRMAAEFLGTHAATGTATVVTPAP